MTAIDALVARLRREIGLDGFPGFAGTARLAAHLGNRIRLQVDPDCGYCRHWEGGITSIWAPPRDPFALSHELGHHFDPASGCFRFLLGGLLLPAGSPSEASANR